MKVGENIRQILDGYTKEMRDILVSNEDFLQVELENIIFEEGIKGRIPDCISLRDTLAMAKKFISAYELAGMGVDIEEARADKDHQFVKSHLEFDTFEESKIMKDDIKSKIGKMTEQGLIKYLIKKYPILGTGQIVAARPQSDKGPVNETKWLLYIAAIALNRVVRTAVGQ